MQSIKEMKYEKECMERHIDSLRQSLNKSESKLHKLKDKLYGACKHNYNEQEVIWELDSVKCVRIECEECGKMGWKMINGGGCMKLSRELHGVDGVKAILEYLANSDVDQIESDDYEVLGETEDGRDACSTFSIIQIADEALKTIEYLENKDG